MMNLQQHCLLVSQIINTKQYKKIVIQIPKSCLKQSFRFTAKLRQLCDKQCQFYTLYDCNKKQCCTDIIGAKHISNYDALFHFGPACFSQHIQPNHHYIFNQDTEACAKILESLPQIKEHIIKNQIQLIIADQSVYCSIVKRQAFFNSIILQNKEKVQVARLPFDRRYQDSYFGFSYYYDRNNKQSELKAQENQENLNVMIIKPQTWINQQPMDENNNQFIQNLYLCRKSLKINKIFTYSLNEGLQHFQSKTNKKLMQRLSQISQLEKYSTFGILVSNPSTTFCQRQIQRCKSLLDDKGLKYFTFMMNNLNQCKLGNFPEIQVYIIIACYNHSLYVAKDFYRLVVSPYDIQVAFGAGSYDNYNFDLSSQLHLLSAAKNKEQEVINEDKNKEKEKKQVTALEKMNNQVAVQQIIQTLDFYKHKQYKGLDFSEPKEVSKIKKGKIGIPTHYTALEKQ